MNFATRNGPPAFLSLGSPTEIDSLASFLGILGSIVSTKFPDP